jgi:hypothetical protein
MAEELYPLNDIHQFNILPPGADAFAGTKNSSAIRMTHQKKALVTIYGTGTTGKSLVTVEKSTTGSGGWTAIPFKYKKASAGDAFGAIQSAAAAGVDTDAGADKTMQILINRNALGQGYEYVRVTTVENVDAAVAGYMTCTTFHSRYGGTQDVV